MKFVIQAPGYSGGIAISPDGQDIAYTATVNGKRQIWVRPIAAPEARALPGTDNADTPFWSPDGRSLAFMSSNKLLRIGLEGGSPQTLADVPFSARGSWGSDGTILFTATGTVVLGGPLSRVAATGGAVTPMTQLDRPREVAHAYPLWLPGDRAFLFVAFAGQDGREMTLGAGALGETRTTPLLGLGRARNAVTGPWPSLAYANGVLMYTRDGTLFLRRLEPRARAFSGPEVAVAENVGEASASDAGTIVYVNATPDSGNTAGPRQLVWYDRKGTRTGTVAARDDATDPRLSPDGSRLAFNGPPGADSKSEIWTIDLARGGPTRRTFEAANFAPTWSPDGAQIVFDSNRGSSGGTPRIYRRAANGTGSDELLFDAGAIDQFTVTSDWSADGRFLLFERMTAGTIATVSDIWVLPLDGERKAFPLLESKSVKSQARLSPDGRWLAYATNESGVSQIVVQPFPAVKDGKWQVSTSAVGGIEPRWRGDGRELYYLGLDGTMMAVEITPGDTFDNGSPIALFKTGLLFPPLIVETFYDVTADGQRFLVNQNAPPPANTGATDSVAITVIVNGTAALEKN